jgi:dynactin-4
MKRKKIQLDQKYFCPYCFDNKVQKEVISLKFKCGTCYSCPCCKNSLIIRASSLISSQKAAAAAAAAAAANSVSLSNINSQTSLFQSQSLLNTSNSPADFSQTTATTISTSQSQKVYYLICGFCRWSSRDVGIPDATSSYF